MYAILGVSPDATTQDIRRRFKKLALQHHPDKNPSSSRDTFLQIHKAYTTLSDPVQRFLYDTYTRDDFWVVLFIKRIDMLLCFPRIREKSKQNIEIAWTVSLADVYHARTCVIPFERYMIYDNFSFEVVRDTVSFSLDGYQKKYVFTHRGHRTFVASANASTDVIVDLHIDGTGSHFEITDILSPYDLRLRIDINFDEYFAGKTIPIDLFGQDVCIIYPGKETRILTLAHHGLPLQGCLDRGDLYIIFDF